MALNANFWIVLVLALGLYFIWMDVALYYRLQVSIRTDNKNISSHAVAKVSRIVRPWKYRKFQPGRKAFPNKGWSNKNGSSTNNNTKILESIYTKAQFKELLKLRKRFRSVAKQNQQLKGNPENSITV